jgi:hypothetical protein
MRAHAATGLRNLVLLLCFVLPVAIITGALILLARPDVSLSWSALSSLLMWWLMAAIPVLGVGLLHHAVMLVVWHYLRKPLRRLLVVGTATLSGSLLLVMGNPYTAFEPEFLAALVVGIVFYGMIAKSPQ